jgi:PAS domain-containing protein
MDHASAIARVAALADILPEVLDALLPYGVLVVDRDDAIVYANAAAAAMLGVPAARLQMTALPALFAGACRSDGTSLPWAEQPIARCRGAGEPVRGVLLSLGEGDSALWLLCDAAPIAGTPYVLATFVDLTARVREEERDRTRGRYLDALREALAALVSRLDPSDLLELLATVGAAAVHSRSGALLLAETGGETLLVTAGTGVHRACSGQRLRRNEGACGRALVTGTTVVVNDYQSWEHHLPGRHMLLAVLAIPVVLDGIVVGVLCLSHTQPGRVFTEEDRRVGEQCARIAAMAIAALRRRGAQGEAGANPPAA